MVKNLPANAGDIETWVQALGEADPLEEGMAAHASILAWRIPWTEGCKESDMTEATKQQQSTVCGILFFSFFLIFACFGSNSSPKSPARLSWAGLASQCFLHMTLKKGLLSLFAFIKKCRTI